MGAARKISLPYNYTPRRYQLRFLSAMDKGKRRACWVVHRRGGKDKTALNFLIKEAMRVVGVYYYFLPTYSQGKKIIWDGIDSQGRRFLAHIPKEIIKGSVNNTEMKVHLVNGSLFQVIGTDNYDSIMGTNPVGCVFSEYSLQDPRAWDFIRPILRENGGWAVFIYTPRGKNHGWDLYRMAKDNPDWFCELLTVDDTRREDGLPVFSQSDIDAERAEGMAEELIQQEYYCSFEASIHGAYYADQMRLAEEEGRVGNVPYEPILPVDTWWDLGMGDSTAIWFTQAVAGELRVIDYYENSGEGLRHYFDVLEKRGYQYGDHWAPHDIEVRELGTGTSRLEYARSQGVMFRTVPKRSIDDGIDAARRLFKSLHFDAVKCSVGINALKCYRKEWDEKRKEFKSQPYHDWASHAADALRYMAVGFRGFDVGVAILGDDTVTAGMDF